MKQAMKKILPLALAAAMLGLTACGGEKETELIVYDQYELHYQSSDGALADFLNDFAHRNLR